MLNFIKNNKYKIIILPAVLLVGIFIGECVDITAGADNSMFGGIGFGESAKTITDNETKQQYIVVENGQGIAITPRLDGTGNPLATD